MEVPLDADVADGVELRLDPVEVLLFAEHQVLEYLSRPRVTLLERENDTAPA